MMTLPRPVRVAVYVAGRPWTVWVVAIGAVVAYRAAGAGGFDAVVLAIGPVLLWLGFSWLCRVLTRYTGNPFERSILLGNRPLPKPQLVVVVVPNVVEQELTLSQIIDKLPEELVVKIKYQSRHVG